MFKADPDLQQIYSDLAKDLRRLRADSGLSGQRVGELAMMSQSKVSKIENGLLKPSNEDISSLIAIYKNDSEAEELLQKYQSQLGQITLLPTMHLVEDIQITALKLEKHAQHIRVNAQFVIPGLLQTSEYARHGYANWWLPGIDENELNNRVIRRMQRQSNLADSRKTFQFLITIPVLESLTQTPNLVQEQIGKILRLSYRSHVSVAVSEDGDRRGIINSHFTAYDTTAIFIETAATSICQRNPIDIAASLNRFKTSWECAHKDDEARNILKRYSKNNEVDVRTYSDAI